MSPSSVPVPPFDGSVPLPSIAHADFAIGDVVRHRLFDFRGVIFDVDPIFANTDEWYEAIPQDLRPRKDQPFYHLLAEAPRRAAPAPPGAPRPRRGRTRRAAAPRRRAGGRRRGAARARGPRRPAPAAGP